MNNFYKKALWGIALAASASAANANPGWPANYEGVMLQGFYWDSYDDTAWTNLEAQADELSKYFKLIWIPNSGRCGDVNNMGYMPQYWFTNHNSSFGTEAELRSMINTYKAKGTGFIADVVVNHRNGVTTWYDFPVEEWRGKKYSIGLDGICCNDELANASGMPKPTGAADTGDNFNGCRDLDHTNANVQDNIKDYCKFLLEDLGYAGFRYDMVKGYGGQYTKIYNEYSQPEFSVGEYWDNYDKIAAWIDKTGKTSAAFDFPCKSAINEAFSSSDMTKLVWNANGDNPQPAGLIHFGYAQEAVTFVDNHDTYRDGSKFPDDNNILAANAFILCSPGTPCVFLRHYLDNKEAIQALINARNLAGISNISKVKVLKSSNDCYMAEVQGSKGKLAVKIGSAWVSPDGYTEDLIKASGTNYCVWVREGDVPEIGKEFTVYYDNTYSKWATPHIYYWGEEKPEWPGVAMTQGEDNIWSYTVPAGTTNCLFNAGDGDTTKTGDMVAAENHVYTQAGDHGNIANYVATGNGIKVYFDNNSTNWEKPRVHYWDDIKKTSSEWPGVEMTKENGNIWSCVIPFGSTGCLFNNGNGTQTADQTPKDKCVYTTEGIQGTYYSYFPETMYIVGSLENGLWNTAEAIEAHEINDGVYTWKNIELFDAATRAAGSSFFTFITKTGADWNAVNDGHRFGAPTEGELFTKNAPVSVVRYPANVSASAAKSWQAEPGTYNLTLDLKNMTLSHNVETGVKDIEADDSDAETVYFDLTGRVVKNPAKGIYIVKKGSKSSKVLVK